MAVISTQGLTPEQELIPEAHAQGIPDNYQTEHATSDTFGANIGQSLEKAGNEAAQTTGFYQQIASDHATNQLLDLDTKIKYGDPAVQGDTGIMGMKGAQAMSAYPGAVKKWDDGVAAIRANLTSPYEQLQFDQMSRRYRAYSISSMASHADQQQTQWAGEVNKASGDINLNAIAKSATDPNSSQLIPFYTNQLVDARVKDAMAHGAQPGDAVVQAAAVDAHREALHAQVLAMAATPQGAAQAQKLLESKKDIAGTDYAPLMQHVRSQASLYQVDQGVADATHQASLEHQGGGPAFAAGGAQEQAAGALRHYEGLRTDAYWDVNHWRTGYGSDTVTKADGSVVPVTQNTTITPADAERDLNRRVVETQTKIVSQITPQAWGSLNKTQQAAVTSMGYNYGLLPEDVVFAIRGGGGPAAISAAILNHQNDNGGVNRQRRIDEARAVNGGAMPSGLPFAGMEGPQSPIGQVSPAFQAAMGNQPQAVQPEIAPGTETPQPPTSAPTSGSSALQPAAYLAQETSPAGYSALTGAQNAMSVAARAMQIWGERTDITPEQREAGFVKLRQNLTQAQFAAEATQQQIKEQSNQQAKGYIPRIVQGDATAIADIARDPNLEFPTQMELLRMAKERGLEGTAGMGPSYNDAMKRIVLPYGDPNRISNIDQLIRMKNDGELSNSGLSNVSSWMEKARKEDVQGLVNAKSAVLDGVKQYMTYGEEGQFPGALKDPKGREAYDKFVVAFEADFDARVAKGENPFDILKDQKGIRTLEDSIRSPDQKRADQIVEQGGDEVKRFVPETGPAPTPMPGFEAQSWKSLMDQRPVVQTDHGPQQWHQKAWATLWGRMALANDADRTATLNSLKASYPDTPWDDLNKIVLQNASRVGFTPGAIVGQARAQEELTPELPPVAAPAPAAPPPSNVRPGALQQQHAADQPFIQVGPFHPENIVPEALRHDLGVIRQGFQTTVPNVRTERLREQHEREQQK